MTSLHRSVLSGAALACFAVLLALSACRNQQQLAPKPPPAPAMAAPPAYPAGAVGVAPTAAAPVPAPPPPAPEYRYHWSIDGNNKNEKENQIRAGHESLLTIAISKMELEGLMKIVQGHQDAASGQVDNDPAARAAQSRQESGELVSSAWASFKYIKAEIGHCPDFLNCSADPGLHLVADDPMLWDFILTAKDSSMSQDGSILVRFSAAATPDGAFIEIGGIPPLNAHVKVVHDAKWFGNILTDWTGVMNAAVGLLTAMAALRGWTYLPWRRKNKAEEKADE